MQIHKHENKIKFTNLTDDKQGIRIAVLLGAAGTCVGAWIKVFSIAPDRFLITFIGQTVVAVAQTFILSLPARLAAVWFGQNEVSSACSIGVLGNQVRKYFVRGV